MSTFAYTVTDSMTMLKRNLRHAMRYPSMTISTLVMPILMLLLFAGLFGNTLGAGLGGTNYIDYLAPGIILMAATSGGVATAVSVSIDMTAGIVNRFRTMAVSRTSILTGHVVGGAIQTLISTVLVIGVAMLMGFRPSANFVEWLAAAGLLVVFIFALSWLAAALGLFCKGPESASNAVLPLTFLPMLGSGFVPTDSMPAAIRWFAEYQPFTSIIETLRGLLLGTPMGNNAIFALGWCVVLVLIGYLWSQALFTRKAKR